MSTMLITFNGTRENGNFMGDQSCYLKIAYLFVQNEPDIDRVIMTLSPGNEMGFLWDRFLRDPRGDGTVPPVEVVYDDWNPGDWLKRWSAWDKWRAERHVEGKPFDHYREMYLRIHGNQRQSVLCGYERGLGRKNIYEYVFFGQEHMPEECVGSDVYDIEIDHPARTQKRDVYISPHAKTQGNITFTFQFWSDVVQLLLDAGVTVTVGFDGPFYEGFNNHPLYRKFWGTHRQWMEQVCQHRVVSCGNTGTGWLAALCGVPIITMEPPNSQMPDHRYRECGLQNLIEVIDTPDAEYVARRIVEEVRRCIVMTTGCYDILHAGHVRHLEKCKAMGTKLIVAMNSDQSVKTLKGKERPINPQDQRKAVLESLRCVDEVRITDDPLTLVHEVRPDVLAVGFGYTEDTIVGKDFVESYGGKCHVTCTGDARDEPATTKIVRRIRAAEVMELCHVGSTYSVNPPPKLKLMADYFLSVKDLPGDVADIGACRGGTSYILHRLAPEKRLRVYDTWDGTPYDDPMCHHKKGEWPASLEECQKVVGNGEMVSYYKGVFPHSAVLGLDGGALSSYCFVYVDVDTEQATRDAIEFFWPLMVPGGKIVVDDYGWNPCSGVKKAVDEATDEDVRRVIPSLFACILEKP